MMENPIKVDDVGIPIIYGHPHIVLQKHPSIVVFLARVWKHVDPICLKPMLRCFFICQFCGGGTLPPVSSKICPHQLHCWYCWPVAPVGQQSLDPHLMPKYPYLFLLDHSTAGWFQHIPAFVAALGLILPYLAYVKRDATSSRTWIQRLLFVSESWAFRRAAAWGALSPCLALS